MQVKEVMKRNVRMAKPDQSIRDAAKIMAEIDAGVVPVSDGDRLIGMITDRDIAVRAVADGKGPETPVREVMTREVKYCFDDEDVGHIARNMGENRLRRLPVMSRDKRLVGIISLGDLAVGQAPRMAGEAIGRISQPGGPHSETAARH